MSAHSAEILGGGLVGSLLACVLAERSWDVRVFEKRSDPRKNSMDHGRSINLILTSRGLAALKLVNLDAPARDLAVPVYGRVMHPRKGDLVFQPYGQKGECNYSISRRDLNIFLLNEAQKRGVELCFNQELCGVDLQSKELRFQAGARKSQHTYQRLFAIDGAGSRLRQALQDLDPQSFRTHTEWLEADYKELTIPPEKAREFSLHPEALHIWARGSHMMMALANKDGGFTVTIYLPRTGAVWAFDRLQTEADVEALFREEFPDAVSLIPEFSKQFLANPQGALGTVKLSKWVYKDEVIVLGDAAHAIVPFFGQGMNLGFEDVSELVRSLEDRGDLENSTKTDVWSPENWFASRKPNADAIAAMALENWVEMKEKVADPEFLRRKQTENWMEKTFPEAFKSRYGLITYTLVPYALTQKIGRLQDELWHQVRELPLEKTAVEAHVHSYRQQVESLLRANS